MPTRAQHLLLTGNYRYTVPRHSAEHARNLTAGSERRVSVSLSDEESRVPVSPPDEELLGVFTARTLNPVLAGGPYSLFQPQPHSIAVATVFIELP